MMIRTSMNRLCSFRKSELGSYSSKMHRWKKNRKKKRRSLNRKRVGMSQVRKRKRVRGSRSWEISYLVMEIIK